MTTTQVTNLLNDLSDEDFEILLRRALKRYLQDTPSDTPISFHIYAANQANTKFERGYWTMGRNYNGETTTEGEILSEVIHEHLRRTQFKSTLLQLTDQTIEGEIDA